MAAINIADLEQQARRVLTGTRAYTTGTLAIGTTKTKVTTGTDIHYSINGQLYKKAAAADVFVHQDVEPQASGTTIWYGCFLDSSGAGTIYKGTASALPDIPVNTTTGVPTKCLVGAIKVVAAATFTPGTTNHDAANITTTYYNLSCVPVSGLPA